MKYLKLVKNSNGVATLVALMVMIMLTVVGLAALKLADDEITIAGNELNEMSSFYAAEAGLETASAAMQTQYEATGVPPTTLPSGTVTVNDCVVAYQTSDGGAAAQETLTQGALAGLHALVKRFTVTSTSNSTIDNSSVTLVQDWQCDLVPIFQFAVFYGNDLEIAPGADMTLIGRVHSNGSMWLQAAANLRMDSYVTCSGDILHGRKGPGSIDNGNVLIKDETGAYQNMKNTDGSFLEATDANWYDSASTRWGGRVQDEAFGQGELNLPLTNADDPHKLIERASGNSDSYENYANIRVIDGVVEAKVAGTWINVSAALPSGTVSTKTYYDGREGTTVSATEIDISKLKTTTYWSSSNVVYFSDDRSGFRATRLVNGSDLDQPLSFFSENPVYVKGDFNTVDKKPCAIAGDAVTFLSNNWNDANSTLATSYRVATQTTVNASIMTGNTNTTSSNYNGGLENLPRFLEKWTGIKFIYKGSLVNLWNSEQAIGNWNGTYYSPPIREWSYDTDLDDPSKLPPETPMVRIFQRTGWQQTHVSYAGE